MVKESAPIEAGTGIPLPLCPNPDLPPILSRGQPNVEREADWHHPFYFKRSLLSHGVAGEALRSSRVQWMMYDQHHEDRLGLHAFYDGPELPEPGVDWFRTTVLACADYVPAKGIAFRRNGEPYIRTLRLAERHRLLNSGVIRVANYDDVKPYFLEYVTQNGVENMAERTIDEFLHTRNLSKKRRLGESLIRAASEAAAEPIDEQYRAAKKQQFLPRQRTRRAANFIGNLLTYRTAPGIERDELVLSSLQERLLAA